MAQLLTIAPVRRRTLLFKDTHYGLTIQAKRLNNGRSTRKQYAVFIPANPEAPARTSIVERAEIKAAIADGYLLITGRGV